MPEEAAGLLGSEVSGLGDEVEDGGGFELRVGAGSCFFGGGSGGLSGLELALDVVTGEWLPWGLLVVLSVGLGFDGLGAVVVLELR